VLDLGLRVQYARLGMADCCLTVVDCFTREAPAIELDTSLPGARVVLVLTELCSHRDLSKAILMDNGPELTSRVLDQWAYEHRVELRSMVPASRSKRFHQSFNGGFAMSA
jgi:putative transposase